MQSQNETNEGQEDTFAAFKEPKQQQNGLPVDDFPKKSTITEDTTSLTSTLLTWCSGGKNHISIIDLETMQDYADFQGAQRSTGGGCKNHVKEISNSKLLVSLNHSWNKSAKLEMFDISQNAANKIYSLEEVRGVTCHGDAPYNSRRNILGAISVRGQISYQSFLIEYSARKSNYSTKLLRRSKWHLEHQPYTHDMIAGIEFNPSGELVAIIDSYATRLITDVNTANRKYYETKCRWCSNNDEPLVFVQHDINKLNIFEVEKTVLTLKTPIQFGPKSNWF